MDHKRIRFYLVLAVFIAWVGVLGYLAVKTSERPQAKMSTGGDLVG